MKKNNKIILLLLTFIFTLSMTFVALSMPNPDDAPELYNLRWNRYTARWAVDGYAEKFQVALYRNDRRVVTKTTTSKYHNFVSQMSRGNYFYYFEVRAYNEYYGWTDWEQSDITYVEEKGGGGGGGEGDGPIPTLSPTVSPGGPGEGGGPGVVPANPEPQVVPQPFAADSVAGNWIPNNGNWYFLYANGTYATNTWLQYKGNWYYFQTSGAMAIGFITINGKTYYLNPDGTMATGTIVFNGITHFFNQDGVMAY